MHMGKIKNTGDKEICKWMSGVGRNYGDSERSPSLEERKPRSPFESGHILNPKIANLPMYLYVGPLTQMYKFTLFILVRPPRPCASSLATTPP